MSNETFIAIVVLLFVGALMFGIWNEGREARKERDRHREWVRSVFLSIGRKK